MNRGGDHRGNFGAARAGFGAGRQGRGGGRNLTWEHTNKNPPAREEAVQEEPKEQPADAQWEGKKDPQKQIEEQWGK